MYLDCPFLETYSVPNYLISDITSLIEESLQNEMYLFFLVDRYYLNNYDEYHCRHLNHEIFIYGYDRELKFFYTADNSNNHKYRDMKVYYSDLVNAYAAVPNNFMKLSRFMRAATPEIDMRKIKASVSSYINSEQDFNDLWYCKCNIYGIHVYEKYINDLLLNMNILNDFRPLHLFWEHKKLMQMRICFLMKSGYLPYNQILINEYDKIVRKFLLLRNLQIRYSINFTNTYRTMLIGIF